jgi:hypothetical protein
MAVTIHGHAAGGKQSPTYNSWHSMRARCSDPSDAEYERYGGSGVTVCERWNVFANFLADMGVKPAGTSIRIDNTKGYEPGNCRWATPHEQTVNRRATYLNWDVVNEIRGRREHGQTTASIARRLGLKRKHVSNVVLNYIWKEAS